MKAFYENRRDRENEDFVASYTESMNFFAHWHKKIEVLYVLEGNIGIGLNKEYRVLQSGDLSICGSKDIHYYNSQGMKSKTVMIIFRPELLALKELGPENISIASEFIKCSKDQEQKKRIESIIKEIVKESDEKSAFYDDFINFKLCELFLCIFRYNKQYYSSCISSGEKIADLQHLPMQKALKYIEDNYSEEITLEILSEEAGLSPFYFSRLFKKTTGTNYNSYLTQLRINNAEHLIKTTGEHIIDIAYKTGFKSIRTFNRTFKSIKGHTPQAARNK